ncbi:aminotransferase class V-fold PLP-dependent enzyme [Phytohabitans suffuscus]|uniref:Aminotransferase class V n=1 Tax=Phytohabitans suffuscus TaxID=624315 RepID=A0A6F8YR36_9ACTN|nr:aminotransferase class V-fold PLP-dependent enzyme [Phytohabitans suffuscus]BCB88655.1 aminotransferase class V [Phytohabitans suffuscus]
MPTDTQTLRHPASGEFPAVDWAAARDLMLLDPTVTYLNAGSIGPLPRTVFEQVSGYRRHLAAEPVDFQLRRLPPLLSAARERLARYLDGDPRQLVLTTNVTGAVNLVASGLSLASPGEILLTDQEYGPMRECWQRAAQRQGLAVKVLRLPRDPAGPDEIAAAAAAAMSARTRMFFFSHVISATGLVMPVHQLCDLAAARGITTVVDGAHGPAFTDLDLADLPCDYYAGSAHKWLLAPVGTGFLHCGPGALERLEPMQVSWGYRQPLRRFEVEGTRDICPWLVLPEATDVQAGIGPPRVMARMRELAGQVRERLTGRRGLIPVTPDHPALSGGMTAFALPVGTDAAALSLGLWERFRVDVAVIEDPRRPLIRVSTHFFNTTDDIERLAEALESLLRGVRTR